MSVELFRDAHKFFSQYVLKDESKERVGKLLFSNPENLNTKGRIDIKVLSQQERALLHFSITGEVPKGFSEKQLQKALQELKGKSVMTEGDIKYEHSGLSSMTKKVHHVAKRAVKGNVIETDHLYQAIENKEKAMRDLWTQIEKSKKGEVNQPVLDEVKEQFFVMVRAMPKESFDKFSKHNIDEMYARAAAKVSKK